MGSEVLGERVTHTVGSLGSRVPGKQGHPCTGVPRELSTREWCAQGTEQTCSEVPRELSTQGAGCLGIGAPNTPGAQ